MSLEEEYDSEYDEYELLRRKKAIAELAATLDSESEQDGHVEKVNMDEDTPDHTSSDRHEGFSNVAGMELEIEEDNLDDIPDELIKGGRGAFAGRPDPGTGSYYQNDGQQ